MNVVIYFVIAALTSFILFALAWKDFRADAFNIFVSFLGGILWPVTFIILFIGLIARMSR